MNLDEVADRLEILELYARYVHAGDDQRVDLLDDVFLPDSVLDYTDAGFGVLRWEDDKHSDALTGAGFDYWFHFNTNHIIEFADERRTSAHVRSKTFNPWGRVTESGEARAYQVIGGHLDLLVKTDAGWRIKERKWRTSWVTDWADGRVRFIHDAEDMLD